MRVELLYFDGCPGYAAFLPRLRELMVAAGCDGEVVLRRVESAEAAVAERFLGSPTIRIEGADVEPGAETRGDFGLKCRLYRTHDGLQGFPSEEWIVAALAQQRNRAPRGGPAVRKGTIED